MAMEKAEYETMYSNEDIHWWFQGTRRVILAYAKDLFGEEPRSEQSPRVLDVGCGTGGTLAALRKRVRVSGVEMDPEGVRFCQERGLTGVVKGRAEALPFEPETFDVVMALDVIEHLDDDQLALLEFNRVLRKDGALLVTVPAYPFLWSEHDVALHHKRRYTRKTLIEALEKGGFVVEKCSYYNTFLFPIVAGVRMIQRLFGMRAKPESDVSLPAPWVNGMLTRILGSERFLLKATPLPFGVSLIAIARPQDLGGP